MGGAQAAYVLGVEASEKTNASTCRMGAVHCLFRLNALAQSPAPSHGRRKRRERRVQREK